MNHYYVKTPIVTLYYEDEPPEDYPIFECVEAESKKDAKSVFVKRQWAEWNKRHDHYNWFYHILGENPFKGLIVKECMCEHGVCNCEIENCTLGGPQDPEYDWCGQCIIADFATEALRSMFFK